MGLKPPAVPVDPAAARAPGGEAALLWRFHSLGDVVLATGVARAVQRTEDLWVATEERFLPVFAGLIPPDRLLAREAIEREALDPGARPRFARVIDLQGTPGSRRLARRLGGRVTSLRSRAASRRWVVFWGDRFPRPAIPHAVERYAEAAGLGREGALARCAPNAVVTPEDRRRGEELAPEVFAEAGRPAVALIEGASRRTKEYPATWMREVAAETRARGFTVWRIAPPERAGADAGEALRESDTRDGEDGRRRLYLPLEALKAVLARASLVIASDSGPMHLAAALGTPVLGIFGSTVPRFGFSPVGPHAAILAANDLPCRPCSVHGRSFCWLGHWRCLRELPPALVVAEALRRLSAAPAAERIAEAHHG
jgi:ADP-heptose:LPS heptosyltransferase